MDANKAAFKQIKKAYKSAKRKAFWLWKTLAVICLVLTIAFFSVGIVGAKFDNNIAARSGERLWKLINEDADAVYYESDFSSDAALSKHCDEICYQLEAEGTVLLLNKNNALPLAEENRVSAFCSELFYGTENSTVKKDDLTTALEKSGFVTNVNELSEQEITIAQVEQAVATHSDAAIVTISRKGDTEFENYDSLALSESEAMLLGRLTQLKADGKVKKIIVLINSSNAFQMDFLKNDTYSIDACLWIGGAGTAGLNAVADILVGKVNPSGSLVDTYCYDNLSAPSIQNLVINAYEGYKSDVGGTYKVYQEGIYTGYKYYETHYEDFVMGTGNAGDFKYDSKVAFPFGYGLSYAKFDYSNFEAKYNSETDQFELSVNVTNIGNMAGKETIQIYVQSPYTQYDKENAVEKSAVLLCGFTKTKEILPGHNEIVTVYVDKRDIASYDAHGVKTYFLDAGDYYFTAATNSHAAINNILAAKGYTAENTSGKMDADGVSSLVYKWTNEQFDATTYSTALNGTEITNQLLCADINLYEGSANKVVYLSRADWQATWPDADKNKITYTDQIGNELSGAWYKTQNNTGLSNMGVNSGITLYDMIGKKFNAPEWEKLLDQLTFDEMVSIIEDTFYCRMPIESINAPGVSVGSSKISLTSQDIMAATFNTELINNVGNVIGNGCLLDGVACLYETGGNIRRTPFGRKNFESYSEDAFLSGEISGAKIHSIKEQGISVLIKDFVFGDYTQAQKGASVWISEQAVRENHLKPFQKPIEEVGADGVICAPIRLGTTWSFCNKNLMTNILRNEWGCNGISVVNGVEYDQYNVVDALIAGATMCEKNCGFSKSQLLNRQNDTVVTETIRNACHRNLYSLVNSSGMNGIGPETQVKTVIPKALVTVKIATIASAVLSIVFLLLWLLTIKKFHKTAEYANYIQSKSAKQK